MFVSVQKFEACCFYFCLFVASYIVVPLDKLNYRIIDLVGRRRTKEVLTPIDNLQLCILERVNMLISSQINHIYTKIN